MSANPRQTATKQQSRMVGHRDDPVLLAELVPHEPQSERYPADMIL